MPPSTWMQSLAVSTAASRLKAAAAAATSGSSAGASSIARAASQASAAAVSAAAEHARTQVLDRLERADRTAELMPDRGVLGRGATAPARYGSGLDRAQRGSQVAYVAGADAGEDLLGSCDRGRQLDVGQRPGEVGWGPVGQRDARMIGRQQAPDVRVAVGLGVAGVCAVGLGVAGVCAVGLAIAGARGTRQLCLGGPQRRADQQVCRGAAAECGACPSGQLDRAIGPARRRHRAPVQRDRNRHRAGCDRSERGAAPAPSWLRVSACAASSVGRIGPGTSDSVS